MCKRLSILRFEPGSKLTRIEAEALSGCSSLKLVRQPHCTLSMPGLCLNKVFRKSLLKREINISVLFAVFCLTLTASQFFIISGSSPPSHCRLKLNFSALTVSVCATRFVCSYSNLDRDSLESRQRHFLVVHH
jgi:hypothetical protein